METLFQKLIGTWTLVELIEIPLNGGENSHPMGENPKGLIMYSADGFMSAQIMNLNRKNADRKDHSEQNIEEASDYLAYSGPFETDDEKKTVSHTMFVSLFPNWAGETQKRNVRFEDEFLYLETEKPFLRNSRMVKHRLTWKRV
jgi:hypothetical protein